MSGIRNLTGICQDIHRNRANVDTPPSGPSTSSRSGRYYRRLSQVRRLVVTSAELVWRNAKTNFNGKVVKGMNEKFLEVGDVMQILGISRSAAYKLMRQINSELEKKRNVKRQIQLADGIIKEDLYTAYYAVSGKEEIVADRDVEIPGMEKEAVSEEDVAVEPETNVEVVNPDNNQNDTSVMPDIRNVSDVNTARMDEDITDVTGKSEFMESEEKVSVDKAGWLVRRISELGGYENISDSVKADIFGFDIADVSGSIWLFSDVMKRLGIKLDGDEMYEEFQRIYDESVGRDAGKDKAEDKMWNRGRGR